MTNPLTATGINRERYAKLIEPRPSRFANEGRDHRAWAARADAWALHDCAGCADDAHPHAFDCTSS